MSDETPKVALVRYEANGQEISLGLGDIKNIIPGGKNLTPQEAMLAIKICQSEGLNPFTGEVYFIKYGGQQMQVVMAWTTLWARVTADPRYAGHREGLLDTNGTECSIMTPWAGVGGAFCEIFVTGTVRPIRVEIRKDEYDTGKAMWKSGADGGKRVTMIIKTAREQAARQFRPRENKLYGADEVGVPTNEEGVPDFTDTVDAKFTVDEDTGEVSDVRPEDDPTLLEAFEKNTGMSYSAFCDFADNLPEPQYGQMVTAKMALGEKHLLLWPAKVQVNTVTGLKRLVEKSQAPTEEAQDNG